MEILIGNKTIKLNGFDKLKLKQFFQYNTIEAKLIAHLKRANEIEAQSNTVDDVELLEELKNSMELEAAKSILLRSEWLACLAEEPEKALKLLQETAGVNASGLMSIAKQVREHIGMFPDWFDQVKPIYSFEFKDYTGNQETFKVFEMANTTLLRDVLATNLANQTLQYSEQFQNNNWSKLSSFVATVARPIKEHKEIALVDDKGFIDSAEFKNISESDKLEYYNQQLEKVIQQREKAFEELPLGIAAGILKGYFQKKNRPSKLTKSSIQAKPISLKQSKHSDI